MSSKLITEQTNLFSIDIAEQLCTEKTEVNLMYLESVS